MSAGAVRYVPKCSRSITRKPNLSFIRVIENHVLIKVWFISGSNLSNSFEATPSLSTQVNLIETPKKAKDASNNSNEIIYQFFIDKTSEKAKFNRLKITILKSVIERY